jgi:hypothetical protein
MILLPVRLSTAIRIGLGDIQWRQGWSKAEHDPGDQWWLGHAARVEVSAASDQNREFEADLELN